MRPIIGKMHRSTTLKNFIYSFLLTSCNFIFAFITYPYVSRVLGVTNIGICNYVDSIITYFVLFSMLGIGSYGVREIAKCKEDKDACSRVFSSLLVINLILSIVALSVLIICIYTIPLLFPYKQFLWIGAIKIFFSVFLIEWFFEGLSNFKYITIRSIVVRIVYAICVFVLIRSEEDVLLYYGLTVGTIVVNSLLNFSYARKFVRFSLYSVCFSGLFLPIISFGLHRILSSFYNTFSTFYLGLTTNDTQVGYFSTACKLYGILIMIFSALTTVLVPRVSELVGKEDNKALQSILVKTFDVLLIFAIPVIIFSNVYASQIIYIIAGPGYGGAEIPFRIVICLLFISAMQQIVVQQFLLAAGNSTSVLVLSVAGAAMALFLNVIFTPLYKATGSAISLVLSTLMVLLVGIYFFERIFEFKIPYKRMIKYILFSIPYVLICIFFYTNGVSWKMLYCILLCLIWFVIQNFWLIKSSLLHSSIDLNK